MRTGAGNNKVQTGILRALLLLFAACVVALGVQAAKAAHPAGESSAVGKAALMPVAGDARPTGKPASALAAPSAQGVSRDQAASKPFSLPGRLSFSPASSVWCVATTASATGAPCANPTADTSLQHAASLANDGDEIRIAQGTYTGSGSSVVTVTRSLVFTGGYAGGASGWSTLGASTLTVVDGQGARKGFLVQGAVAPTIQNLTVNNGGIGNTGTINVSLGALNLRNGGSAGGTFNVAAGAEVDFPAGTVSLDAGTSFVGAGSARVLGGIMAITGTLTAGNLELSSGTIGGAGVLAVPPAGTLTLSGTANKFLDTVTLDNTGIINWTGSGTLYTLNAARANNAGTLLSQGDRSLLVWSGSVPTFTNSGTINTVSGTLTINTYVALNTGSTITGAGSFRLNSVYPVTISGTVSSQNLELASGGTITGTGTLLGNLNWTGGTMQGPGSLTVPAGNTLSILGASRKDLDGYTLNNAGTVARSGNGTIYGSNAATINNSGLFDEQVDGAMSQWSGAAWSFSNTGTFRKSAGTGSQIGVPFNNSGVADVRSGVLTLSAGGNLSGGSSLTGSGVVRLTGGTTTLGGTIASQNLEVAQGGTLSGTGTVVGTANWTGGAMHSPGSLTVPAGSTLNISGPARKDLDGYTINNSGTINWTATGILYGSRSAVINNDNVLNSQGTNSFDQWSGSASALNNNRTLAVISGTLSISTGGTGSGNYSVPASTKVILSGGTYTLNVGTTVTGAGALRVEGATVPVTGAVFAQNLEFAGGIINGAGSLNISGSLNWSSGTMSGIGSTNLGSNSVSIMGTNGVKYLDTRLLQNAGTLTWSGTGDVRGQNAASFENTGLVDAQNDQTIVTWTGVASVLDNYGTFRKSAGSATTTFNVIFNNFGALDVQTGTVALAAGGTFADGSTAGGAGLCRVVAGGYSIDGTVSVQNFEIAGGTFGAAGTIQGSVNWTGGTLQGPGTLNLPSGSTVLVSGSNAKYLDNLTTNSAGTFTWTGPGDIRMSNASVFNNNGLFEAQNDQFVVNWVGTGLAFNNYGTFRKTAGTGQTQFNVPFKNYGTANVLTGVLAFNSTYVQNSGALNLVGGNVSMPSASPLLIQGGVLAGAGVITGTVSNSAVTSPGVPAAFGGTGIGTLAVNGSYIQSPTGTLNIDIAGIAPGSQYDRLAVPGNVNADGTLNILTQGSYSPDLGDTFAVLTYTTRTTGSAFATITGTDLGNGRFYVPAYNSTGLNLTVSGSAATPTSTRTSTPSPTGTRTPTNTATATRTSTPGGGSTPTATPTVTSGALLVGHVLWQGAPAQPSGRQELPVTLVVRAHDGGASRTYADLTTDASGYFTASVGSLAPGTYDWWAKGPKYLAKSGTLTVDESTTSRLEIGTMLSGDANGDNVITLGDFNIMRGTWAKSAGDPGYDGRGEFNNDLTVSAPDFTLLRSNLGLEGAPPFAP